VVKIMQIECPTLEIHIKIVWLATRNVCTVKLNIVVSLELLVSSVVSIQLHRRRLLLLFSSNLRLNIEAT